MKETTFPTREALLEHFDRLERDDPFDAGRQLSRIVLNGIRSLTLTPGQPAATATAMVKRAVLNLQEDFQRLEDHLNSGTQDIIGGTHNAPLKIDGNAVLTYQEAVYRIAADFVSFLVFETYGRAAAAGFKEDSPEAAPQIDGVLEAIRNFQSLDFHLPEVVAAVAEWNRWCRKDKQQFEEVYAEIEVGLHREWMAVWKLPARQRKVKPKGPKLTQSATAKAVRKLLAKNPNLTANQLTTTIGRDELSAVSARQYKSEYFKAFPDRRPSSRPKKSKPRKM